MTKNDSEKRGPSTSKLFLVVIVLVLIPTTMEQLEMHQETVRNVGRVCVGLAGLYFVYGLFSKVLKFSGVLLLLLIGARALANEGVIEFPKLKDKLATAKENHEERR